MTYFCSWWTWTCMEPADRRTVIFVITFSAASLWKSDGQSALLWVRSCFFPHKPDFNSSSVESCLNCIQLIILLLRIFPVSGRVIHLYPSQLTPAWWHMTASAWVSTDWLISPLALPLWDNGNEWQHVQRVSKALHATLAATSGALARSTAPLPLRAHVQQDAFWQLHQNLHDRTCTFFSCAILMNTLCEGQCDESARWGLNNGIIILWVLVLVSPLSLLFHGIRVRSVM